MKRATVFDYSLLALIRDSGGITLNCVHEGGHAVVGAYWRLPIRSVRLEHSAFSTRYRKGFGGHVTLSSTLFSKSTVDTMLRRGEYRSRVASKLNDCAAMALGARAAVELIIPPHLQDEGSYRTDEEILRNIASSIGIQVQDVLAWREAQFQRTAKIVRIDYVKQTILDVAADLENALSMMALCYALLNAPHVRGLLQENKRKAAN